MKTRDSSILARDPLLHQVWEQLGRPSRCCVTGGYVRDRLLGRPSNDLDLTIDGDADEAARPARRLAKALGVRAHLFGSAPHRIWRIETSVIKIEIWPLGGLTADEDIRRRDFGCNALSWELPEGPFVDLVGGMDDLDRDRLRAISRANLESDPVRLLRAPRFLAQLPSFDLDEQTRSWIRELGPSLADAPRERIGQELLIMLRGPAASRGHRRVSEAWISSARPLRRQIGSTSSGSPHISMPPTAWPSAVTRAGRPQERVSQSVEKPPASHS